MSYDLVITNITINHCVSIRNNKFLGKDYREGYLIWIQSTKNPTNLHFVDCNFSYLNCNGMNGGGIGLSFI